MNMSVPDSAVKSCPLDMPRLLYSELTPAAVTSTKPTHQANRKLCRVREMTLQAPPFTEKLLVLLGKEESPTFEDVATGKFPMLLRMVLHLDTCRQH